MFLERCVAGGGAFVPEADMRPRFETPYCSGERVIVIRGLHWNLNLREVYERLYGAPRADDVVRFILARGALVLSRSPEEPALVTGIWPGSPGMPLASLHAR